MVNKTCVSRVALVAHCASPPRRLEVRSCDCARAPGRITRAYVGQLRGDGYPPVAYLDEPVALELAHHLRDGLAGRDDHVRQILVREAYVQDRARPVCLPETLAEVEEQRGQTRRDFPVQEAFNHLVGLLETLGEGAEQLHGELRPALYDLGENRFPHHGHPGVGNRLGEDALVGSLVEAELAEDAPVLQQRDRGLLVIAVDLVEAHRALEQEVELSVGIAWGEDKVLGSEASLGHSDARSLEIFEAKVLEGRGCRGTLDVVSEHLPALLLSGSSG